MATRLKKVPHHCYLVGMAIRRRREKLGLSQEGLSEIANVHRNFTGRVERGETNVTLTSLMGYATALKTSLAALCEDAGI